MITTHHFCYLCKGQNIENVVDLGESCFANALLDKKTKDLIESGQVIENKAPLRYFLCKDCSCFGLRDSVDPSVLFSNYLYSSSTSGSLIKYFDDYVGDLTKRFSLNDKSFVFEIASNDGVMLQAFKNRGIRAFGIEPSSNLVKIANDKGLYTIEAFFNEDLSKELAGSYQKCDIVTFNNCYFHLGTNIDSFTIGVKNLLKDKGVAVFENASLLSMVKNKYVDILYHEHTLHTSVKSIKLYLESHGLELFDVYETSAHGGSTRYFCGFKGQYPVTDNVAMLLAKEEAAKIYEVNTYKKLMEDVDKIRGQTREFLDKIQKEGKRLACYSYPAKATTLASYFGIGRMFEYVIEDSKPKQNHFTSEFHLPIVSKEHFVTNPVDYMFIFAWNFADLIMENNKDLKVKWIVPLPEFQTVD